MTDSPNQLNESLSNNQGRWTYEEHQKFIQGIIKYGLNWNLIHSNIKTRSKFQARSHAQKFLIKLSKNNIFKIHEKFENSMESYKVIQSEYLKLTEYELSNEFEQLLIDFLFIKETKDLYGKEDELMRINNFQKRVDDFLSKKKICFEEELKSREEKLKRAQSKKFKKHINKRIRLMNQSKNYIYCTKSLIPIKIMKRYKIQLLKVENNSLIPYLSTYHISSHQSSKQNLLQRNKINRHCCIMNYQSQLSSNKEKEGILSSKNLNCIDNTDKQRFNFFAENEDYNKKIESDNYVQYFNKSSHFNELKVDSDMRIENFNEILEESSRVKN